MFLKRKDCALPVSGHETTADYGRPVGPFFVPGFKDFLLRSAAKDGRFLILAIRTIAKATKRPWMHAF